MNKIIDKFAIDSFAKSYDSDNINHIISNQIRNNGISNTFNGFLKYDEDIFDFSVQQTVHEITDQKQSGRCWIFAAINCVRTYMILKYNLKDIHFSQNYIAFYDLLEKSNYFMETIIANIDKECNDRLICHLLLHPIQDAGQWSMFCNIVNKYGLILDYAMPNTYCAEKTMELIEVLSDILREFYLKAKAIYKNSGVSEIAKYKEEVLNRIYRCLCLSLGVPPKKFNINLKTNDGRQICKKDITPSKFYNDFLGMNLSEEFVCIINAPTDDKPFNKYYTVKYLGNVIEGDKILYYNMNIDELKRLTVKQLKAGQPVWFGCDSRKYVNREKGILDINYMDYSLISGNENDLSKGDRLQCGISYMTHAMVFRGFNEDNGHIDRWFVENSYGPDAGHNGCLVMTDDWFNRYVYEVVIEKRFIDIEDVLDYKEYPIEIELWDPMGALAK